MHQALIHLKNRLGKLFFTNHILYGSTIDLSPSRTLQKSGKKCPKLQFSKKGDNFVGLEIRQMTKVTTAKRFSRSRRTTKLPEVSFTQPTTRAQKLLSLRPTQVEIDQKEIQVFSKTLVKSVDGCVVGDKSKCVPVFTNL